MAPTSGDEDLIKFLRPSELSERKSEKYNRFVKLFQEATNSELDFIICCPGRVNLIGDHIDYHGFPVLPMALEKSIWLGCSFSSPQEGGEGTITLYNSEQEKYPDWSGKHSFSYGAGLNKSHKWEHYVLCGYHGVLATKLLDLRPDELCSHAQRLVSDKELLIGSDTKLNKLGDIRMLVDSDLQEASGLSSSSALVCASAVATLLWLKNHHSNEQGGDKILIGNMLNRRILADYCSKFEHLIGTHGGGMDQAVIMTAQEGYAKYVEFVPELSCGNVRLPDETIWLISHCSASFAKAATTAFNTRVLETKIGASLIAKALGPNDLALDRTITLKEIKTKLFTNKTTEEIVDHITKRVFDGKNEFTVNQICTKLDMTRAELVNRFNTSSQFLRDELGDKLQLTNRCVHAFQEAERVERFKSICDTTTDIVQLGQLMTQSHYSLRDKYECSHPALDRLISVALDAGALGSRLTGAGWGGCIVALVEVSKEKEVLERLREVSKFTFRTEPQFGCQVIKVPKE